MLILVQLWLHVILHPAVPHGPHLLPRRRIPLLHQLHQVIPRVPGLGVKVVTVVDEGGGGGGGEGSATG